MRALIENIQYVTGAPNAEGDDATAFVTTPLFKTHINFKQADLAPAGENWGDDEVRDAVQEKMNLDPRYIGLSFLVVFPDKAVSPATPEEPAPPAPAPSEPPAPPAP